LSKAGRIDTIRSDGPTQLDALIVLTDGFGPSPVVAPAYPVLWLIAPEGKNSCPFEMVVELPGN
jgi:predicted metal-dependent peptidase